MLIKWLHLIRTFTCPSSHFLFSLSAFCPSTSSLSAPRPSSSTQSMWLILRGRYRTNSCRINWMGSLAPRQQRDVQRCSLSPRLMFPSANVGMNFKGRGGTYTWKMSWNRSPWESMPFAADWGGCNPSSEGNQSQHRVDLKAFSSRQPTWNLLTANPSMAINHRLILALCESVGWSQKLVWWEDDACFNAFFSFWEFSLLQPGWDDNV